MLPLVLFSCPNPNACCDEFGVAFPLSELWLNARFIGLRGDFLIGLRGDVRVLGEARNGAGFLIDRSDNFALGGKGTARGDGVCEPRFDKDDCRFGGDRGEGESGDFGDWLGDFDVTKRNFDGERDNERLRDLTADPTSTW